MLYSVKLAGGKHICYVHQFHFYTTQVERKDGSNDDQVYVEPKTPEKTKEKRKVRIITIYIYV